MGRSRELAELAASYDSGNLFGMKNRIINGAMMIDQRNAGASVTPVDGQYVVDRWCFDLSQASKITGGRNQGSVTPPVGYVNYFGITSSSAYSVGTTDAFDMFQAVEGLNVADLGWGAVGAASVTLSFWVRSSLTGTFGGAVNNSGNTYNYPFTYTINAANTWEQKTVTIAGPTTGTWLTTNGVGLIVRFSLGAGSSRTAAAGSWTSTSTILGANGQTSVVGTNGATFYITGVQLEKGSTATSFDFRSYGTELQLCQRYFYKLGGISVYDIFAPSAVVISSTAIEGVISFPVQMRSTPTGAYANALSNYAWANASAFVPTAITFDLYSLNNARVNSTISGGTANTPAYLRANASTSAAISFSAEL